MTSAHSLYGPGLDGEPMEPITFAPGTASVDLERQYLDAVARAHGVNLDGSERRETRLDPAPDPEVFSEDELRFYQEKLKRIAAENDAAKVREEFDRRFDEAKKRGLVDVRYTLDHAASLTPDEFYRQANRIDGPSRERLDPARELPNDGVDVIRALEHAAAAATSDSDRVAIACELWRARGRRAQVIRRWAESLSALFPNRRKWRAR